MAAPPDMLRRLSGLRAKKGVADARMPLRRAAACKTVAEEAARQGGIAEQPKEQLRQLHLEAKATHDDFVGRIGLVKLEPKRCARLKKLAEQEAARKASASSSSGDPLGASSIYSLATLAALERG